MFNLLHQNVLASEIEQKKQPHRIPTNRDPTTGARLVGPRFENKDPHITNVYDRNWPVRRSSPHSPNDVHNSQFLSEGVRVEATPFYLANPATCPNIQSYLDNEVDDFRLVLMLREPADRAFSEYMMKMRRIGDYEGLIDMVSDAAIEVFACMGKFVLGPLLPSRRTLLDRSLQPQSQPRPKIPSNKKALDGEARRAKRASILTKKRVQKAPCEISLFKVFLHPLLN